mmetsp:Transcript_18902/g.60396  ORF Transcript_18902/g.60396 Transcript_18902/m.60396 type:complete len:265 (+) Transcript_18902:781-1575(+)
MPSTWSEAVKGRLKERAKDGVEHDVEPGRRAYSSQSRVQLRAKGGGTRCAHDELLWLEVWELFQQGGDLGRRAHGPNDARAEFAADADGLQAAASRSAVDEDCLVFLQVAQDAQGVVGGQGLGRESSALRHCPALRELANLVSWDVDVRCKCAKAHAAHYPVTGAKLWSLALGGGPNLFAQEHELAAVPNLIGSAQGVGAAHRARCTNLLDDTGKLEAGDERALELPASDRGVEAGDGEDICKVEADALHAHQDLAAAGGRDVA